MTTYQIGKMAPNPKSEIQKEIKPNAIPSTPARQQPRLG
jgi:hypothetical protein